MQIELKHLPIFLVTILSVTLLFTFCIAFLLNHITYFLPYISDSGSFPPESCIFGQILNIMSILLSFAMYIKYRQVEYFYTKYEFSLKNHKLNYVIFVMGLLAALGVSIVANFQETTMFIIHWIGACMAFGLGAIYQCLQSLQYIRLKEILTHSRAILIFKIVLSLISLISFIVCFVFGMASYYYYKGTDVTKWQESDGGFKLHLTSTGAEWICAICTMLYVLGFTKEFRQITILKPEITIQENEI